MIPEQTLDAEAELERKAMAEKNPSKVLGYIVDGHDRLPIVGRDPDDEDDGDDDWDD